MENIEGLKRDLLLKRCSRGIIIPKVSRSIFILSKISSIYNYVTTKRHILASILETENIRLNSTKEENQYWVKINFATVPFSENLGRSATAIKSTHFATCSQGRNY